MALKSTMETMKKMLETLMKDLAKVEKANKAAAQRVRTGSIKFAKHAKTFRKESVAAEKKGLFKKPKKTKKPAKKTAKRKPAKKAKKASRRKKRR